MKYRTFRGGRLQMLCKKITPENFIAGFEIELQASCTNSSTSVCREFCKTFKSNFFREHL